MTELIEHPKKNLNVVLKQNYFVISHELHDEAHEPLPGECFAVGHPAANEPALLFCATTVGFVYAIVLFLHN